MPIMELSAAASTIPTEKDLSGDEITPTKESETTLQKDQENASSPEFNPNWRFYLAFATLAVVTLAVCLFLVLRLSPLIIFQVVRHSNPLLLFQMSQE
jgi:hypothetical protein